MNDGLKLFFRKHKLELFFLVASKICELSVTHTMGKTQIVLDLAKIYSVKSHAAEFCGQQLRAADWSPEMVLRCFRLFFVPKDGDTAKLDAIMHPSAVISRGQCPEKFYTPCFMVGGLCVSKSFVAATPQRRVKTSLREIEMQTRPAHLRNKPGYDMDHVNTGGFASIADRFIATHGLDTLAAALFKKDHNSFELLPEPYYTEFVHLHSELTNGYALCQMEGRAEHVLKTKRRRLAARTESPPR